MELGASGRHLEWARARLLGVEWRTHRNMRHRLAPALVADEQLLAGVRQHLRLCRHHLSAR